MLGDNTIDDIMTAQGLQYLHGLDLAHHGDPNVVHHGQPGVYLRTDADVARELQRWRQRCRDYDTDPAAWSCRGRGRD